MGARVDAEGEAMTAQRTPVFEGGGRYDDELHAAVDATRAAFVLLLVYEGHKGSGFSIGIDESQVVDSRQVLSQVPAILRAIADGIEDQQRGQN